MVELMKAGIEKKGNDYYFSPSYEPHDVATVIKNYFQDLEEPAFTFALYPQFISSNLDLNRMKELVNSLPIQNRVVLQVISYSC